jgi:hypothetical protein
MTKQRQLTGGQIRDAVEHMLACSNCVVRMPQLVQTIRCKPVEVAEAVAILLRDRDVWYEPSDGSYGPCLNYLDIRSHVLRSHREPNSQDRVLNSYRFKQRYKKYQDLTHFNL